MSAADYGYENFDQMIRHAHHNGGGLDCECDVVNYIVEQFDELATLRADLATAQATVKAQGEQLRAFESAEHCLDCGGFMVLPADAPEDAQPFCPFCLCEKQGAALEQAREMLDLIVKNSKEVSEGDCVYCNCEQGGGNEFDCYYDCPMNDIRKWLAAHPAPARDEATA